MSSHLRQLAGATAVALAFSPLAHAERVFDNNDAMILYRASLSSRIAEAVPEDNNSRTRAGGFIAELDKVLALPQRDKATLVVYPQTQSNSLLVISAVVPPTGAENILPAAGVCAQQNGSPKGAWFVMNNGKVIPQPVVLNPEGSTAGACQGTVRAMNAQFKELLAKGQPQPPPVVAAAATTVARASTTTVAP